MKQLTCEMCGSNDLVKQDGFFVCQACGCKYSVEEAKKMMIEGTVQVSGGVEVKNAAQLENLLNLAQSSFTSKNYAQAEEFCNQVIAMDATNYAAWKLKGEAINYQINYNNPRILEVYNCIMTSYDVLKDEDREDKRYEIIDSLKTCFEGEVKFWVEQIEAKRPTEAVLNTVKKSYVDSYNKMAEAFTKLGFNEDDKQGYLKNFDNYFIKIANETSVSAWKSTVGYNYYRGTYKDGKWTDNDYRPTDDILKTFLEECDILISLLNYATEQFNDLTDSNLKAFLYENMAYFNKETCNAQSFTAMVRTTTVYGYTSSYDYWKNSKSLTDEAKASRKKIIAECEKKAKEYREEAIIKKRQKDEDDKNKRIKAYWEKHKPEKDALDKEKKNLEDIKEKSIAQISELQKNKEKVPSFDLLVKKQKEIEAVEAEKNALGFFKFKEKKELQEKIDTQIIEKTKLKEQVNIEQQEVEKEIIPIREELNKVIARLKEIDNELTKDR